MIDLFRSLQAALKVLDSVVEPEDARRCLMDELQQLSRSDLVLWLQPSAPRHWRMVHSLPPDLPPLEIVWGEAGSSMQRTAVEQVLQQRQGLCCEDPVRAGEYDFSHLRAIEIEQERLVVSSLLLPLTGHDGQVDQLIELVRLDQVSSAVGFSADEFAAASILVQQAQTKLQKIRGGQEQREMFESLIQLIGSAIDEKSPYAGDHCRRVPVLTLILARAVHRSSSGAFRNVFFSDADLYELEVAAWLHDIGKLVTPIQVTDKATKLERTIDRFDLVRTRFEILRRDLEIARLRKGGAAGDIELPHIHRSEKQMIDDLRFLADCNRGWKSLTDVEARRVHEIAQQYFWVDRQGEELPVLTADEAANLMVLRGTITDSEREMINHHVVSTINMLDMLPFPDALSRVPEIAAAHHEYHNGQGFPSGLRSDQMLVQARILGFADLFESISAGSRPYKKRNSLSQALKILRDMVDEGRVDPELFHLFIDEKLYEGYAIEFLSRDQVDPVDRNVLLKGL